MKVFDGKETVVKLSGGFPLCFLDGGRFLFRMAWFLLSFIRTMYNTFFLYSGQSAWSFCIYSIMLVVRGKDLVPHEEVLKRLARSLSDWTSCDDATREAGGWEGEASQARADARASLTTTLIVTQPQLPSFVTATITAPRASAPLPASHRAPRIPRSTLHRTLLSQSIPYAAAARSDPSHPPV